METAFELGTIVCTMGVNDAICENKEFADFVQKSLTRHILCDWGDMCDEDKESNNSAVANGDDRIFSAYNYKNGVKVWIITEWDRSVTTILFPEEY